MLKPIKFVYVAGPLTPRGLTNGAIEYLLNVRVMIEAGRSLLEAGFVPFVPALDMLFFLTGNSDTPVPSDAEIKSYSMSWLSKCDAMVVLSGWELSPGTRAEMDFAFMNNIEIYFSVKQLLRKAWRKGDGGYVVEV